MRVKYELELVSQMNHGHKLNDEIDRTTSLKSSVEVICYLTMNVIEVDE